MKPTLLLALLGLILASPVMAQSTDTYGNVQLTEKGFSYMGDVYEKLFVSGGYGTISYTDMKSIQIMEGQGTLVGPVISFEKKDGVTFDVPIKNILQVARAKKAKTLLLYIPS